MIRRWNVLRLKCNYCNYIFSEDELYEQTKLYYSKTNSEVKRIMLDKKGGLKPNKEHKYICPVCKHIVDHTSLRKEDG